MFKDIKLTAVLDEFGNIKTELIKKSEAELEIKENEFVKGCVKTERYNNSYLLSADVEIVPYPYDYYRCFDSYKGLVFELDLGLTQYSGLSIYRFNPFWTKPVFFEDFTQVLDNTQQVLMKNGDKYIHIMPFANAQAQCCIRKSEQADKVQIRAGRYFGGSTAIKTPICVVSVADNPYKAVKESYDIICNRGMIITPEKKVKKYPEHLEGLGWCTWNAFYHDVTAEKIEQKLKEFREKEVQIKWIMIDDGWAMTDDLKLKSCCVDENKFPGGLKKFIDYIKEEYSIEYVGIWHAFTGYWFGADCEGEQYLADKDIYTENNSGILIPGGSEEAAYTFFYNWHSYLKEQGVDFLKVDVQGGALEFYKNTPQACRSVVNMHNALERSVYENFGSVMINCMGMSNLNAFSRSFSSVIRNSDDFFPDKENGFESHIMMNAYNAIFNDNLYYCDYDMWWTQHFSAKQSSVLRAISGGPVYISDELGNTDKKYLIPLIDRNGKIIRCDSAAKPTDDCILKNPASDVIKIFNTSGEDKVIALFNLSGEKKTVTVSLKDIYSDGEYYMHRYFTGECDMFKDGMEIELEENGVEIINLYKVKDGAVMLGNTDKYISVACPDKVRKEISFQ